MRAAEAQLEKRRAKRQERRLRELVDDLRRTGRGIWAIHEATEREDLALAFLVLYFVRQFLRKGTKEGGEDLVNAAKRLAETRADVADLGVWRLRRRLAPAPGEQPKDATPIPVTVLHKSNVVDLAAARRRRDAARKG